MAHEDLRPSWGVATDRHGRMKSNYAPSPCLSSGLNRHVKATSDNGLGQVHHRDSLALMRAGSQFRRWPLWTIAIFRPDTHRVCAGLPVQRGARRRNSVNKFNTNVT